MKRTLRLLSPTALLTLSGAVALLSCGEEGASGTDPCGPANPCAAGSVCMAGRCQACATSCQVGAQECVGAAGLHTCQTGADGCPGWSAVQPCPNGSLCNTARNTCECTGECAPGATDTQACQASSVGECRAGTRRRTCLNNCAWSRWTKCEGQVGVHNEVCDGKDNDCDGSTDEGIQQPCTDGCGAGIKVCEAGRLSECRGGGVPALPQEGPDNCNNVDDDCDGTVDNVRGTADAPLTRECDTGCGTGSQTCFAGRWSDCLATGMATQECPFPGAHEIRAVEGGANEGICAGVESRTCRNDCTWSNPVQAQPPQSAQVEQCNALDDDCDGTIDNIVVSEETAAMFLFDEFEETRGGEEPVYNDECDGCKFIGTDPEAWSGVSNLIAESHYDPADWFCFDGQDARQLSTTERIVVEVGNLSPDARFEVSLLTTSGAGGCQALQELESTEATAANPARLQWFEGTGDDDRRFYVRVVPLAGEGCYQLKIHGLR